MGSYRQPRSKGPSYVPIPMWRVPLHAAHRGCTKLHRPPTFVFVGNLSFSCDNVGCYRGGSVLTGAAMDQDWLGEPVKALERLDPHPEKFFAKRCLLSSRSMGRIVPRDMTYLKAVLPVEFENIGCAEIELCVMPDLLWVHKANDRTDSVVENAVDPPDNF